MLNRTADENTKENPLAANATENDSEPEVENTTSILNDPDENYQDQDSNQDDNSTKHVETIRLELNEKNTDKEIINPKGETITAPNDSSRDKVLYPYNESDVDYIRLTDENLIDNEQAETSPVPPPIILEKSKSTVSLLPDFVHDFLASSMPAKQKCEPQSMLEKIRKERLYPRHPTTRDYHLLQTQAPSFLQRLSLAGEFAVLNQFD